MAVRRLIAADFDFCLDAEDRAYYRRTREAAFGCLSALGSKEQDRVCPPVADRHGIGVIAFRSAL